MLDPGHDMQDKAHPKLIRSAIYLDNSKPLYLVVPE